MDQIKISAAPVLTGKSHSSKGNQWKWRLDGYWYKADLFGCEGLAEVIVSEFLKYSNLDDREFVSYYPVEIDYTDREGKNHIMRGCRSEDFLCRKSSGELHTIEKITRQYTMTGLAEQLGKIIEAKDRISYAVDLLEKICGVSDYGIYITKMLEIDALFLNEDRHTNNISMIYQKENGISSVIPAPFYDHGAALFSDISEDFPLGKNYEECLKIIKAKPFSADFDDQLDAAEELYGNQLKFKLTPAQAGKLTEDIISHHKLRPVYSEEEINRLKETIGFQVRKYRYMFTG